MLDCDVIVANIWLLDNNTVFVDLDYAIKTRNVLSEKSVYGSKLFYKFSVNIIIPLAPASFAMLMRRIKPQDETSPSMTNNIG